jgi:ribose 5-phosphate isomerase RpiB
MIVLLCISQKESDSGNILKLPYRIIVNNDLESMYKKWLGPIFTLPHNMNGGTKKNHEKCQNDKSPKTEIYTGWPVYEAGIVSTCP